MRSAARVLVIDAEHRLLLLEAKDVEHRWWIAPGGGLEPGESFEDAARREAAEELGFAVELGACVWFRRHRYVFSNAHHDQYERYFVVRSWKVVQAARPDDYVVGMRWWTLAELNESTEDFAPRSLPRLIGDILDGRDPLTPFDCGV